MLARDRVRGNMFCLFSLILVFALFLLPSMAYATNVYNKLVKLSSVNLSDSDGCLKMVFDFEGRPFVKVINSGKKDLLVYDFSPAVFPEIRRESLVALPSISRVVIAQHDNRTVRVTISTDGAPIKFSSGLRRGKSSGLTAYTLNFSPKKGGSVQSLIDDLSAKKNPSVTSQTSSTDKNSFIAALEKSLKELKQSNCRENSSF